MSDGGTPLNVRRWNALNVPNDGSRADAAAEEAYENAAKAEN